MFSLHRTLRRCFSGLYGGSGPSESSPARVSGTLAHLDHLRRTGQRIVVLTAYDAPTASLCSSAAVSADVVLVGDSVGMVSLGYPSTVPVTLEAMVHHCAAVSRGVPQGPAAARGPLLLGDLPFGSYGSVDRAVESSVRLVREGGMHMVKLEGGLAQAGKVRAVVEEGIPVVGHIGLLPQTALLGGGRYSLAGRHAQEALRLVEDALAIQAAGARALVLEMVPWQVAAYITRLLHIPTIGIGAGPHCSGQVLVCSDALGFTPKTPFFVRRYAELGRVAGEALAGYASSVRDGTFPGAPSQGFCKGMAGQELQHFLELAARHHPLQQAALQELQAAALPAAAAQAPLVNSAAAAAAAAVVSPATPAATAAAPLHSFQPVPAAAQQAKIAILGSGAVASLLASTLAGSGYSVTLLSHWRERVQHINARGIAWMSRSAPVQQSSDSGSSAAAAATQLQLHAPPPPHLLTALDLALPATQQQLASSQGQYDLVFLAGSAVDADQAYPLAWRLLHSSGAIIPLHNGHYTREYGAGAAPAGARPWQLGAGLTSVGATLPAADAVVERTSSSSLVNLFLPGEGLGPATLALVQGLVATVAARQGQLGLAGQGLPLSFALHPAALWAPHRLTKLLVNSVLNPVLALSAQQCGSSVPVNGDFAWLVQGACRGGSGQQQQQQQRPAGPLAATAQGLCEEAAACLGSIAGYRSVPGWEGVADAPGVLQLVLRVAEGTSANVNSMVADGLAGRVSEVDFIAGPLVQHLGREAVWNSRVLQAVSARERALGHRSREVDERIERVKGCLQGGRVFV